MSLQPYARNFAIHSKSVRAFSSAPKIKRKQEDLPPFQGREQLKVSQVNNVVVASVETNQALAKLGVFFKAGSRNETDSTQGVVHMLRICAGLGTKGASHFGITRNIEFAGGNLACTTGRECIGYTLEAMRDKMSAVDRYLKDAAVNQAFKPWEINDNVPRLRIERSIRSPEVRIMELIHKAAYRKGLGYSLYSPKWMIGNHTSEMLADFVSRNFGQACVIGVGLPHEQVQDFTNRLDLKGAGGSGSGSKFHAGADLRKETGDKRVYVALALEGAPANDPKRATAAALVHRALGASPRICGGSVSGGKLSAAVGDSDTKATVMGFSASYSDSGMVGAYIAATPKSADAITRKAADILKSVKFTSSDATRAKGILKGDAALVEETASTLIESLATQSLQTGKPLTLAEHFSLIDSITAEDMNAVIKDRKLSMAVFGNVAAVPHLDELK
jgi:ubiquinol-cytochrome c reductase core subunit 2